MDWCRSGRQCQTVPRSGGTTLGRQLQALPVDEMLPRVAHVAQRGRGAVRRGWVRGCSHTSIHANQSSSAAEQGLCARLLPAAAPSYEAACSGFEWHIPEAYNMAEDACDRWALADPERTAIVDLTAGSAARRDVTYRELQADANRLANRLAGQGVRRGRPGLKGPRGGRQFLDSQDSLPRQKLG